MRRFDGVSAAVVLLGALGAIALIVGEFLPIASVDVATGSCEVINDSNPELADRCSLSGFERHGGALALLGVLGLLMAWGAGLGRSRPAGAALIAVGVIALVISFASDLPETQETGAIGRNFEGAVARKGPGLYVDWIGGVLAIGAGALRLARPGGPPAE